MKKSIKIQTISLLNFKGIRKLTIDFNGITNIHGDNATGKTTVFDAFTWLLFGKDSHDRKDFEIKTLDKNNVAIPKIDHEVSAIIEVDGIEISLKRNLKENWVKKKGSLQAEFTGHTTELYWDDVPVSATEYSNKVNKILEESIFKLITNPFAFNSLKWQDRRSVLMDIAGNKTDAEYAGDNLAYQELVHNLTNDKTLDDYKKQVANSVKKAKDDLKVIPTRIDEVERSKPEALDFTSLKSEIETKSKELQKVNDLLDDSNKAFQTKLDAVKDVRIQANELSSEINIIEVNARKEAVKCLTPDTSELDGLTEKLAQKKAQITEYRNAYLTLSSKKDALSEKISGLTIQMDVKREDWSVENKKELTFNDEDFHCPTCKREFESGDVEAKKAEMLERFNTDKAAKLKLITADGTAFKVEKENLEAELKSIQDRIKAGLERINKFQKEQEEIEGAISAFNNKQSKPSDVSEDEIIESLLKSNTDYQSKKTELEKLQATIKEVPSPDNSQLIEQRQELTTAISELKAQLQNETRISEADKRIAELMEEEKLLAQQIADVEKTQFTIEEFEKFKAESLEEEVNGKFKLVNFKMFETQINGGIAPTCVALIDGVPFTDANTASRINAGLDIINTLCEHYGVTAPIFIDNRESIIDIIDTESQLINLIVSEGDKKLRVESGKLTKAVA